MRKAILTTLVLLGTQFVSAQDAYKDDAFKAVFGEQPPAQNTIARIELAKRDFDKNLPAVKCFHSNLAGVRGFLPPLWSVRLVSLDRSSYALGDLIRYTLAIENDSTVPVKIPVGLRTIFEGGADFLIYELRIKATVGTEKFDLPDPVRLYENFIYPYQTVTLNPGERIEIIGSTHLVAEKGGPLPILAGTKVSLSPGTSVQNFYYDEYKRNRDGQCSFATYPYNRGVGSLGISIKETARSR